MAATDRVEMGPQSLVEWLGGRWTSGDVFLPFHPVSERNGSLMNIHWCGKGKSYWVFIQIGLLNLHRRVF